MEETLEQDPMANRHVAAPRPRSRAAVLAVLLLALGIIFAALYRVENSREHHSYNAGAQAPFAVQVTGGKQYEISTPGGVKRLAKHGIAGGNVTCTYQTGAGVAPQNLAVTALGSDTRTVHAVATFVAPISGALHIACGGLSSVFVDDADNAPADPAGLFILLTTISLTAGAALGMSVLYRRAPREPVRRARQREQEAYFGHLLTGGGEPSDPGAPAGSSPTSN